jgi:hypothetical protein
LGFRRLGSVDPRAWGLPNVVVFSALSGLSLGRLYQANDVSVLPRTGEGLLHNVAKSIGRFRFAV